MESRCLLSWRRVCCGRRIGRSRGGGLSGRGGGGGSQLRGDEKTPGNADEFVVPGGLSGGGPRVDGELVRLQLESVGRATEAGEFLVTPLDDLLDGDGPRVFLKFRGDHSAKVRQE